MYTVQSANNCCTNLEALVASIPFKEPLYLWEQILVSWGVLFLQETQNIDLGYKSRARPLLLPFITGHPEREFYHQPALRLSQRASLLDESIFLLKPIRT
jgi:hypothetical protein